MFESDGYLNTANETFTRRFYFPEPLVTMAVMMDNIESAHVMAIKIEFLGMDRETKHSVQQPFAGGTVTGSKDSLFPNLPQHGNNVSTPFPYQNQQGGKFVCNI